MKTKTLISLCAGTLCAALSTVYHPGVASAATTPSLSQKAIVLNTDVVSKPYGFVVNNTTYLPIWYVMQTLDKLGIKNDWKDKNWTLTTTDTANLTNIQPGTGSSSIYVNGHLVQKVFEISATDPASGNPTTYMPAWYVMQVLKRLHVNSNWNGTIWQVYTGSQAPSLGNADIQVNQRPPASRAAVSLSDLGQQIVSYAKQFIGVPYQWGGESTTGFDCSGLVQSVFTHFGISLPRTAAQQASVGQVISKSTLQPGDLVFFDTDGSEFSHVGIYVGNDEFISATTSQGVQIRNLNDPYYWGARFTRATNPRG